MLLSVLRVPCRELVRHGTVRFPGVVMVVIPDAIEGIIRVRPVPEVGYMVVRRLVIPMANLHALWLRPDECLHYGGVNENLRGDAVDAQVVVGVAVCAQGGLEVTASRTPHAVGVLDDPWQGIDNPRLGNQV